MNLPPDNHPGWNAEDCDFPRGTRANPVPPERHPERNPIPKRKGGMRPIPGSEKRRPCCHPAHQPPTMLYIPPGHEYVHICPGCGAERILRGSPEATLRV